MKQIPLTQGKFALVDDEDFDFLNQWKWHAKEGRNTFYAVRTTCDPINKIFRHIKMHRQILNLIDVKILGDHIDGDGLNNQRYNLRTATPSQNGANAICKTNKTSTKFLGVSFHKKAGKWEAHIKKDYKKYYLGLFEKETEAAEAYNKKAKEFHGEFANLNVI